MSTWQKVRRAYWWWDVHTVIGALLFLAVAIAVPLAMGGPVWLLAITVPPVAVGVVTGGGRVL